MTDVPDIDTFILRFEVTPPQLVRLRTQFPDLKQLDEPRWIASMGAWEDIATASDPGVTLPHYKWFAPPIGPFDSEAQAIRWLRGHSMALGTDEDHQRGECSCGRTDPHVLSDERYAEYVMRLDGPDQWVTVRLGDEPGEFTAEGAIELLLDANPDLKKKEEPEEG